MSRLSKQEELKFEEKKASDIKFEGINDQRLYLEIIAEVETEGFWVYEVWSKKLPAIKKVDKGLIECSDKNNAICTLFI